jgi:hypothetical protein
VRSRVRSKTPGRIPLRLLLATAVAAAGFSSQAWAQAGFYLTPSLGLAEAYDDNIFSTPEDQNGAPVVSETPTPEQTPIAVGTRRSKTSDYIFQATPGLLGGYQSKPFTLLAGYKFGSEVYAEQSELSSAMARQDARVTSTYLPDPLLTLGVSGGYLESNNARQLNAPVISAETGLPATAQERPRARAEIYYASPSVAYQYDPLSRADASYTFSHSREVGATTSDTHNANTLLEREITQRDAADLGFIYNHFSFQEPNPAGASPQPTPTPEPAAAATPTPQRGRSREEDSEAVTVGLLHRFSERTSVRLRGGPRFHEGSVDPEALGEIRHKLERGDASFVYARTQTTGVGISGALDVESFAGTVSYEILQRLFTGAALALYRSSRSGEKSDVYAVNLFGRYQLAEWLWLTANYDFQYQDGVLGSSSSGGFTSSRNQKIYHNIVTVGVEASEPFRVY